MGFSPKLLAGRFSKMHPAAILLLSFAAAIGVGAGLLMLPAASRAGSLPFEDALFTAVSAVCVTGLVVVDTGAWFTRFGQCVILALIQIGGLGVMTVSVLLFRWMGKAVSVRQRLVMQDLFAHTPREDIFPLIKSIFLFTAAAEGAGALCFFMAWAGSMPAPQALFSAVFHSASAFCNAGFSLYSSSMCAWKGSASINVVVCLLIIVGGIGFPVLYDLHLRFRKRKGGPPRLFIQTKTVLAATGLLIVGGAAVFFILERHGVLAGQPLSTKILAAVFQSVTCRTAGFNTVDISALNDATLTLMIFLMFVGASPGSCGGGVKTTTLAVLAAFTWSRFMRRRRVALFKKSIPRETVGRSVSLLLSALAVVAFVLFMMLVGNDLHGEAAHDYSRRFLSYLFEAVSAFGTVGLSMGVTASMNLWDKLWICVLMFVGRVGVLTFAYVIAGHGPETGVEYSEENIMIG